MTDFSSLSQKVTALKALVGRDAISPVYLGSLLDDFIVQLKAIDMTDMADDVQLALANAATALSQAKSAALKSDDAVTQCTTLTEDALASCSALTDAAVASCSALTSAAFRALWLAANLGAAAVARPGYDEATGLYTLNGLTDITEEQARRIYAAGILRQTDIERGYYMSMPCRTFMTGVMWNDTPLNMTYGNCAALEVAYAPLCYPSHRAFYGCAALRKVTLYSLNSHTADATGQNFYGCTVLQDITAPIRYDTDVDISDSPLISYESLHYAVANAQNTTAVTVRVHPDVFSRIVNEWGDLEPLAAEHNIFFASAK